MRSGLPSLRAIAVLVALTACGSAPTPVKPVPLPVAPPAAPPGPAPLAIAPDPEGVARIKADVTYLASPELAGRGTGEPGAMLASQHLAIRFENLHLLPLGDVAGDARGYRQAFTVRVGATAKPPVVSVGFPGKERPLPAEGVRTAEGSASGSVHGDAVFVGHGVSATAVGWDDYAGASVEGKIVVVLDGAPSGGATDPHDSLRDFGGVRYKLRTAREHKAAGAIIVLAGEELPPLPADASSMGIPAVVVTQSAAKPLLPAPAVLHAAKAQKPSPIAHASVAMTTNIEPVVAPAFNVLGFLPGDEKSPHAGEIIVVGAHYDHLGYGGTSASRAPGVHAIHPGADDNASGTALMLEVARRLSTLPRKLSRSVLFIGFGAEELGVLGSRYFVEHPPWPLDSIDAMINADMVGRMRNSRLLVDGVGTSAAWPNIVHDAAEGLSLDITEGAEGFGASDHTSFTAAHVPVEFLFTGVHDDYHMPSDTADKIDAAGIERAATLAARMALLVSERPDKLVFVDAPADPHRGVGGGFKVSLGTIPDYAFQGKGVRLTGVRPESPAARAGITGNDVIVKVGEHEITNIHDYVFALGELEPGREIGVEVERDGKRLALKVIPAPGR